MTKPKKILRILGRTAVAVAVVATLAFVERSARTTPVTDVDVTVSGADGVHFLDAPAVRRMVLDQGTDVIGTPVGEVDLSGLEDRLNAIPAVARANVYHGMDGVLQVQVEQREPIVRVLTGSGPGCYLDRDGWTFPTSEVHTARVLVATGPGVPGTLARGVRHVPTDTLLSRDQVAMGLHALARTIHEDPLLDALFDQVIVTAAGQFELLPRVGGQVVLIGDGSALKQRFNKLKQFYEHGMAGGDWRRYERIDLRFTDQIVCTQRSTP
ncbi:MAG: hypothetical protein KDB96_05560 [Flavobacteriales bacterium]|nr:hypothetical protein [Flavobacteriales bacterium]MCB0788173.1 hypothetical protein [Flavobacteriales bacterium]MCB0808729.1 hypothetical protein [Flavobacteriales bacterium]MCB0812109.1 hypothetical protein [Flavobacteriales bacterium]MCB0817826.1 hypothetical protein [Flavobacteriales bacterium]